MERVAGEFEGWGSALRRRSERPGKLPVLASLLLHGGAIAIAFLGTLETQRVEDINFVQYRVRLVSPPPTEQGPPTRVETTTTPVITAPEPKPVERPEPKQAPKTQAALPKKVESKPKETKPVTGANPKPSSVAGEGIDITIEGQEFPYPDYLSNIVLELNRYFRWGGAPDLSAEVTFMIKRDGSVSGIKLTRRSGNFRFDIQAVEAVEQAGRARAFGPLPANWQSDVLPIRNTFAPR